MLSVIVCTYNRRRSLLKALEALGRAAPLCPSPVELIVVDNNSTDGTRETVAGFSGPGGLRARYVFEGRQGTSAARNRGVREAAGGIIAFTDDDVLVAPDWPLRLEQAFVEHPAAACVGGRTLPLFEGPCPEWLSGNKELLRLLALSDYGPSPLYLDAPEVFTSNIAFRARVFYDYGGFDTLLGSVGERRYRGEDTEFIGRLLKGGEKILYSPLMTARHVIPRERMLQAHFRRLKFDSGERAGYFRELGLRTVLRWSAELARRLSFSRNPAEILRLRMDAAYCLGYFKGSLLRLLGRELYPTAKDTGPTASG